MEMGKTIELTPQMGCKTDHVCRLHAAKNLDDAAKLGDSDRMAGTPTRIRAAMKKKEERYFLERFAELRPDLQLSEITDSEEPDFICHTPGGPVGIELTRFAFPHSDGMPPAARDRYRKELGEQLRVEHALNGLPPAQVSVSFSDERALGNSSARHRLMVELLRFAAAAIPKDFATIEFDWSNLPAPISEAGVSRIAILRHRSLTKPFWSFPYAGFIPESTSDVVQAIITKKADRIEVYRRKADVLWLVIVSGTTGLHSIVDYDRDVLTASYTTRFDRAFVFRTFGPSAVELKVCAA